MPSPPDRHVIEPVPTGSLEVYLLGCVELESALTVQERLVHDLGARSDAQGALLLCEHAPVITIGREGSRADLLMDDHELTARQMSVRWVNRGGGSVVHAPGQLAVYPIIPLRRRGIGPAEFRTRLEAALIDLCRHLRVPAWSRGSDPGVCCRLGQFAHIGAAVRDWVSWQGMFVNVNPAPEFLRMVRAHPNGVRMTSLTAQRQRSTPMHVIREGLMQRLAAAFGYERMNLYTRHPMLRRTRQNVHVPA